MKVNTAESLSENAGGKSLDTFAYMSQHGHEQLVQCYDEATGLKAVIGIHSTVLGPAMGGTRMWHYATHEAGIMDALRLSRAMTYKSSIAGLNVGGGKAVLIGDAKKLKSEAYLRRFGKFIESLNGKYVTAGDVNISPYDLEFIRMQTRHVTGLPETLGGGGSSSLITAFGVYMGIKAAAQQAYGNDSLENKKVMVQGVGAVGMTLLDYLSKENCQLFVSDVDDEKLQLASKAYKVEVIDPERIFEVETDIYAPCALGAILNDDTIPLLKCQVIAGGANNQLEDDRKHGQMLLDKGIVYAPDFLVNGGGIMAVAAEYFGEFHKEYLYQKAERIYDKCLEVLQEASTHHKITQFVALEMAEKRIEAIAQLRRTR